jgi:RNA polymerase sigma-70 factor (ECF subfamily)
MVETSPSLLDRLRGPRDDVAWQRMTEIYTPLIRGWLRRHARLANCDADDVVQDVLAVVVRRLPEFERERAGSFRTWLRSITVNCLRRFHRTRRRRPPATGDSDVAEMLNQLADSESALSRLWDREHDEYVMRQLLELIRPRVEPKTWQAFERVALRGEPAQQVASELGLTTNAVFIAKSRVLAKLRAEAAGLID